MARSAARAVVLLLLMFLPVSTSAAAPAPAAKATSLSAGTAVRPSEAEVTAVASQLRCVVCQSLSVADSPSEMATQMRGIVRERLAAGDAPDEVVQYFVDKYGEWILLAPRARGFTLLVWLVPALAVVVGLAVAVLRVRGWTRPKVATTWPEVVTTRAPDAAMRERIRKELEAER
jgi:cytochrome c-type biogenesis protein CcmH